MPERPAVWPDNITEAEKPPAAAHGRLLKRSTRLAQCASALAISSVIFFASPSTITVLSR
jgi:hypothetical protein